MKINLVSDCKYHNLVLMKTSTFHKAIGNEVYLNGVGVFDQTIGSWLFTWSEKSPCDIEGGPGVNPETRLPDYVQRLKPDYSLFPVDYSLGYTWEYCPRKCEFCCVPKMNPPKQHQSIWTFHDPKFKKICLLNNNTFSDPQWKETFEEIWDADLIVRDENGYDLRLMDEEKAEALRKTKFEKKIHYAWDQMEDEGHILKGLKMAPKGMVYVLVGFKDSLEEDLYRCQKIHDLKFDPYIMPYRKSPEISRLKEFINVRAYWKYDSMKEGFENYKGRYYGKQLKAFKRFIDTRMYRKYEPTDENKGETIKEAWRDYRYKE